VRAIDLEPYRGRWVAVVEGDERVIAAAESYQELHARLGTFEHPPVLVHRVPTLDEPVFNGFW
jgi:hypothetical protein